MGLEDSVAQVRGDGTTGEMQAKTLPESYWKHCHWRGTPSRKRLGPEKPCGFDSLCFRCVCSSMARALRCGRSDAGSIPVRHPGRLVLTGAREYGILVERVRIPHCPLGRGSCEDPSALLPIGGIRKTLRWLPLGCEMYWLHSSLARKLRGSIPTRSTHLLDVKEHHALVV